MINNALLEVDTKLDFSAFQKSCTATTLFMLYALGYKPFSLPVNFVNAYIADEGFDENYTCPIFVLYRIDTTTAHRDKMWSEFEKSMKNNPSFQCDYYVGKEAELDLVMYVFETPKRFQEDYYKFLEGKYSEFSEEYKTVFSKKTLINNVLTPVIHYLAIEKNETLRQQVELIINDKLDAKAELWPKPDISNRETFKRSK